MLATINWKPSHKEMRVFGAVFVAGFSLIALVLLLRGSTRAAQIVGAIGAAVGGLALIAPPLARPFYLAWMGVAFVMGGIVSFLILMIIFYLIITPLALIMRLAGRDELALKRKPGQTSYWTEHPALDDKSYYERLF
jgi:hypothetical protein